MSDALTRIVQPRRRGHPAPDNHAHAQTIRALNRADDTPNPDRQFLRDLRSTLMDTSHVAAPRGLFDPILPPLPLPEMAQPHRLPARPVAPDRPGPLRRFSGATMRALEIAAVAALLLTMLGFAAGDRGVDGIRALLTARQDDPAPAAMYLGNAAHTGEMPGPGPDAAGEIGLVWRAPASGVTWTPDSSPVVADGILYLTTRTTDPETRAIQTGLAALDLQSGMALWEIPLPGFISDAATGSPVVADGIVYVGLSLERWLGGTPATPEAGATPEVTAYMTGAVIALDAQTGQELWTYDDLPRAGNHPPVLADGVLYVVSEDGTLHALDAMTGDPRWTASASDDPNTGFAKAPSISGGTLYIPTHGGTLYALDVEDGTRRWDAVIGGNQPTLAAISGDTVFIGAYASAPYKPNATPEPEPVLPEGSQQLYALDAATGTVRWSFDPGTLLYSAPIVAGDTLVVTGAGESGTDIVALNVSDGAELWRSSTNADLAAPAAWSGETVYVGSQDSNLYALDLATGAVQWQVATGGGIASPAFVADGVVAFTSYDGNVYALSAVTRDTATPAAAEALTNDISGLAPCTITPRPALEQTANGTFFVPVGTPTTASVRPDYSPYDVPSAQNILFADLPDGDPASQDITSAIQATIADMTACDRPGYENHLAAYFSDDYFRRNPVNESFGSNGYGFLGVPSVDIGALDGTTVLPDGRVATVFRYSVPTSLSTNTTGPTEHGVLYVWVESDGQWMVDEWAELSDKPLGPG